MSDLSIETKKQVIKIVRKVLNEARGVLKDETQKKATSYKEARVPPRDRETRDVHEFMQQLAGKPYNKRGSFTESSFDHVYDRNVKTRISRGSFDSVTFSVTVKGLMDRIERGEQDFRDFLSIWNKLKEIIDDIHTVDDDLKRRIKSNISHYENPPQDVERRYVGRAFEEMIENYIAKRIVNELSKAGFTLKR